MISPKHRLGLAIMLWGALCSGVFAGFVSILLQFGFIKGVAIFTVSGFLSSGIAALLVVRRYRKYGVAGLQGTGPGWGALAGFFNAIIAATAVMMVMEGGASSQVFEDRLHEVMAILTFGVLFGGIYGIFFGLLIGGVFGLIFEAWVLKWYLSCQGNAL
ncbi:MAG: hypothetical protein A2638_05045 [Nitrospirae bacterium RIFCSPHIGHO2_01_FULL_66_17]|nr:MAG: hypothetical protein A2638_05045 [Nitrospirae bacterium RIFCSPHIGHO2_01_FULL_66_17]